MCWFQVAWMTHMKSHTSERLPCPACSKPFLTRYLLNQVLSSKVVQTKNNLCFSIWRQRKLAEREYQTELLKLHPCHLLPHLSQGHFGSEFVRFWNIYLSRCCINAGYHRCVKKVMTCQTKHSHIGISGGCAVMVKVLSNQIPHYCSVQSSPKLSIFCNLFFNIFMN